MTEIKRREVTIPFSAEEMKGAFISIEEARKRRSPKPHGINRSTEQKSVLDSMIEKGLMDKAGNYTEKAFSIHRSIGLILMNLKKRAY